MEQMAKQKISWKRGNLDGEYEGQLKNGRPHILGEWKQDGSDNTVVGEWKDGKLNGKAVLNVIGQRFEYEAKNGNFNGKLITYNSDGSRA